MRKWLFAGYVVENLFSLGNEWIELLLSNDEYVQQGAVVVKPQRITRSNVEKNRTDIKTEVTVIHEPGFARYDLQEYDTDPEVIRNVDQAEYSYNLMESSMFNQTEQLREDIAKDALYDMAAADTPNNYQASAVMKTTGAATASHLEGTTGNRKLFTEKDLRNAKFTLNKQGIRESYSPRTALIPSDKMMQLYDDLAAKYSVAYAKDVTNGTIPSLHGFKIVELTNGLRFTNDATPVAKYHSVANSASDNDSVLCFCNKLVSRARGTVEVFYTSGDPEYKGDVIRMSLRFKVQKERMDGKGVISIVQDTAA